MARMSSNGFTLPVTGFSLIYTEHLFGGTRMALEKQRESVCSPIGTLYYRSLRNLQYAFGRFTKIRVDNMRKVLAVLIFIAFLTPSPAFASKATTLNLQCGDAMRADDWGTAAAYCQETYETFMQESRAQHGLIAYEERELGDIALGAAGYANLHFDANTGQDQVSRAADDLQQMLNDDKCPQSVKSYITTTALPLVQKWSQYTDDGSL